MFLMTRIMLSFLTVLMYSSLLIVTDGCAQELWVGKDGAIRNVSARAMVAGADALYLATRNALYKARDGKGNWEEIFYIPAGENEIRCVAGYGRMIFVGTRRGLFRSTDHGATWKNVFKTIIAERCSVLCVEAVPGKPMQLYIGTERGVFMSSDDGDHWKEISENVRNKPVEAVAASGARIYALTNDGLYVAVAGTRGWERLLVRSATGTEAAEEPAPETTDEPEEATTPSALAVKEGRVYVALGKKLLFSEDDGKSWHAMALSGLAGSINAIAVAPKGDTIYCATTKGIFQSSPSDGQWHELYSGIDKRANVSRLVFEDDKAASLWALTDKGVYRLESGKYIVTPYVDVEKGAKTLSVMFSNEPTFKDLQQAAIRHAEVSPEKIARWRQQAQWRAVMPKVSVGLDHNRSTNTEIYTSASREYAFIGPDDFADGFDVGVSWDLGDLIWNDAQTSIDVRSRLMVQLRNDILDDLRRVYYERRRIQYELTMEPPQNMKVKFEKELRLQELTQAIDDLTGNYFSEAMNNANNSVTRVGAGGGGVRGG